MLVPDRPFQPSLMFARAYTSLAPFRCSTLGPWTYPQTLDQTEKACHEQKFWLITNICNKEFYNIGPRSADEAKRDWVGSNQGTLT